jgi:tetratricopeptide (TPR) repeat protein
MGPEQKTRAADGLRYIHGLESEFPQNLYFSGWEGQYFYEKWTQPEKAFSILKEVKRQIDDGSGNFTPSLKRRIYLLYARSLMDRYRLHEALNVLEGIANDLDGPPPWAAPSIKKIQGDLYNLFGEREKALESYRSILSLDRKKFRVTGSTEKSIQKKILEPYDSDKAKFDLEILEGKRLVSDGRAGKATGFFDSKLRKYPQNPEITYWLGLAHFMGGDLGKAEELFRSLDAPGKQIEAQYLALAHLRLGQIQDLEGKRQEAVGYYNDVNKTAGAPSSVKALANYYLEKPCTARELFPPEE